MIDIKSNCDFDGTNRELFMIKINANSGNSC